MAETETAVTLSTVFALAGCALAVALTASTVLRSSERRLGLRRVVFLVFFASAFVPVYGLPVAGYLRGFTGDLSTTTLILLFEATIYRLWGKPPYSPDSFRLLMLLAGGAGLFLYPFALGLTYFDPYVLGYGSKAFIFSLFILSLATAYFDRHLVAICLTGAVLGYSIGLYESTNLWDYLIDPWLVLYALFWIIGTKLGKLSYSPRPRPGRPF
jgi:hypothetical protein